MVILLAQVPNAENLIGPRGSNTYSAGIKDADKGYIKYAPKSTDQPNLLIPDTICDNAQNMIMPGYYELTLSPDRQMLTLSQGRDVFAVIPVFKIEEDKSQEAPAPPRDKKSLKKFNKEQKKKEKKTKKLIKEGRIPDEPAVYVNASIQYDVGGDYYLIKYERGKIRAWAAIKTNQQ